MTMRQIQIYGIPRAASVQVVIEAQMCCPVQHETRQEAAVLCKLDPVGGVRKPAANHEVSAATLQLR